MWRTPPLTQGPRPGSLTIRTSILWGPLDSQEGSLLHPQGSSQGEQGPGAHPEVTGHGVPTPGRCPPRGPADSGANNQIQNHLLCYVKPDGNLKVGKSFVHVQSNLNPLGEHTREPSTQGACVPCGREGTSEGAGNPVFRCVGAKQGATQSPPEAKPAGPCSLHPGPPGCQGPECSRQQDQSRQGRFPRVSRSHTARTGLRGTANT